MAVGKITQMNPSFVSIVINLNVSDFTANGRKYSDRSFCIVIETLYTEAAVREFRK